ncbi:MAG: glycosyl hydrolase family 38, partial [Bacteroidota bacterium]
IDRLLRRIKEGRIEVTGMYFNFAEIVDETALGIQTQALRYFKEFGIDVTTAMQNDVNGIGWCMVDLFHDTGLKYLSMGQHGHRARIPFDKPTSFWWESPSGKRLLAYRSEHYMHGNTLRLTSGKLDVFRNNLSKYLTDLDAKAYPLDRVALQFSGYITDNSPPSTRTCQIVKEWNDTYEWPKLKLSLASEFMMYLEDNHSDHLETKRVAWPDWWADGFGSATNETKLARTVHSNMIATMGLLSMAQVSGSEISGRMREEINRCYEDLLFYDEHTFGADESISNPLSKNSIDQWRQKSAYVWSANQRANLLREKAIGIIMPHVKTYGEPSVTVFNTLNWKRSGLAHVFIDHDIIPSDRAFRIVDDKGEVVPAQIASRRNDGINWAIWVEDVPPLGYATYRIDVLAGIPARGVYSSPSSTSLENDHYKLVVDLERGGLRSLVDKQLGKELLDQEGEYPLGAFVLEQLDNRAALERLTYLNPDTVYRPLVKQMVQGREYKIAKVAENRIWSSIFLNGTIPECADEGGLDVEIRLYHLTKKIELVFHMNKLSNTSPEGGYVAFPFAKGDDGRLVFEVQGGLVEAGVNQLEGTASDWNTIQNFAAVRSENSQVVFCSNDIPLVQMGSINTGRYYYKYRPETGHIYSWVFNNYWTTNFRADQRGELEWTYQLTSSGDPSNSFASKFGWENRIPLVARFNVGQSESSGLSSASLIDLNAPDNLLLVNARPSLNGQAIFLHVRETEGDHAILDVTRLLQSPQISSAVEVNSLEEEVKTLTSPLLIEHFETKFLLLKR